MYGMPRPASAVERGREDFLNLRPFAAVTICSWKGATTDVTTMCCLPALLGPGIETSADFPPILLRCGGLFAFPGRILPPSLALCKLKTESDWRQRRHRRRNSRVESSLKHMKGVATRPTRERRKTTGREKEFDPFCSKSRSRTRSRLGILALERYRFHR